MSHTHIATPWLARVRPPESGASAQQAFPTPWVWGEIGDSFIIGIGIGIGEARARGRSRGRGRVLLGRWLGVKGVLLAMISRGFGSMWDVDVEV